MADSLRALICRILDTREQWFERLSFGLASAI